VESYEDLGGKYFPKHENERTFYRCRPDGRVEKITMGENESRGEIVSNQRPRLTKRQAGVGRDARPRAAND